MAGSNAPVSGAVVFEWSPRRYAFAAALIGVVAASVGWLSVSLLLSALADRPSGPAVAGGVAYVSVYAILFPAFSLMFARDRPPALRFGSEGIELAAERRDAVLLPYEAVSSARIRWPWPVTVLQVFVDASAEPKVTLIERGGRRPFRKRRGDQLRFSMPIAGLRSPAADIRSQLQGRGIGE
jgi:MFS family permease